MSSLISELILHEALIFPLKFIFFKEYYFRIFLSLKPSERFLTLLPPGLNCGNEKYYAVWDQMTQIQSFFIDSFLYLQDCITLVCQDIE